MRRYIHFLAIVMVGLSCSFTMTAQVQGASADKTLMYVFTIAENSSEESQETPFSEKLTFNYSQNPDLKFLEGKTFDEKEIQNFVNRLLKTSKLTKLKKKEMIRESDTILVNVPAKEIMERAKTEGVNYIIYLDIKSFALVKSINQGKTLFRFNRNKPEETTIYDYFYNVRGDVAFIDVAREAVIFRRTIAGLDYEAPRQQKMEDVDFIFYLSAEKLGDLLFTVIKEQLEEIK